MAGAVGPATPSGRRKRWCEALAKWRREWQVGTLGAVSDQRNGEVTEAAMTPTLTVAAVARRLGVAPATLRTWARRYGVGPGTHTAGSHRRYSAEDLARLVIMRQLTHEGVAPAEAARMAMAEQAPTVDRVRLARVLSLVPGAAPQISAGAAWRPHGDANVVPLPEVSPAVRGLARASLALDANGVTESLRGHLNADGVLRTWDSLITPVLLRLGDRWASTGEGVEVEHMFSECVIDVLRAAAVRLRDPRGSMPVLLACLHEEQHSLPLYALAAALAEHGVGARQLGSRMPTAALAAAVRRSGPGVVFLFAAMPVARVEELTLVTRLRPAPLVLVGGPGWPSEPPPAVRAVFSLQEAVDAVLSSVL